MLVSLKTQVLAQSTLEKDLGIWINDDLTPSTHIAKAVCKANQIMGLIQRTFTYLDSHLMKAAVYLISKTSPRIWKRSGAPNSEEGYEVTGRRAA